MSWDTLARIHHLAVFAECLAVGLACRDSAGVREAVVHLRRVYATMRYTNPPLLLLTLNRLGNPS